ncbi:MAG: MarR family transcriptional regulator [Chloroflexi bacterium]|nr:MarR family transcriptional regulator [Chloroflexota bacterium]
MARNVQEATLATRPARPDRAFLTRPWEWLRAAHTLVPQLLEDLGLDGLAAFPPRPGRGVDPTNAEGLAASGQGSRPAGALQPHLGPAQRPSLASVTLDLPPREARLLGALDRGAATVDELVATTGLPVAAVLGGLTGLEDRGLVEEGYGRYRVPSGAVASAAKAAEPAA